jgi:hypothetical protein
LRFSLWGWQPGFCRDAGFSLCRTQTPIGNVGYCGR